MATKNSRAALLISIAVQLPDNNTEEISPLDERSALTDLYDTLIPSYQTVSDEASLASLVLGTNFKEGDFCKVLLDGNGQTSNWQYIRNRATSLYAWYKISSWSELANI